MTTRTSGMASASARPQPRVISVCGGSMTNLNVLEPDMAEPPLLGLVFHASRG